MTAPVAVQMRVRIVVPLLPPSVNHYKTPFVRGGVIRFAVTPQGHAFKEAIAVLARGETLVPANEQVVARMLRRPACSGLRYRLTARVVLGPGQRGDGDNFWKCIADGLVEAGVIHSDAAVREWLLVVDDEERRSDAAKDPNCLLPRTEITAEVLLEPWEKFRAGMPTQFTTGDAQAQAFRGGARFRRQEVVA